LRIGMPFALSSYTYYPLWKIFLEILGQEVIPSELTNKSILDLGVKSCVDDACLPIKIFHGHVLFLDGKADTILIPQIMSVQKKEYSCPLICGLPEMVRYSIALKTPVLELKINLYKGGEDIAHNMETFGLQFTNNKKLLKHAFQFAYEAYVKQQKALQKGFAPEWMGQNLPQNGSFFGTLGVLGHPYVLYDPFLSGHIIRYFAQTGFDMLTPERIDEDTASRYAKTLPKKMFWSAGRHLYGSAMHMAAKKVDGILYISSFGCGVDSIIADLCERIVRKSSKIPFLLLVLDEHTGEAGIKTRIEAFCDMILWRQKNGRDVSPHGQYIHCAQGIL